LLRLAWILSIIMLFSVPQTVNADIFKFESIGFGLSYGNETSMSDGWDSKEFNYFLAKITFPIEHRIKKTNFRTSFEPAIGFHRAWNDELTRDGVSLGLELWLNYDIIIKKDVSFLFIAGGGGFSTLLPNSDQPELANSGVLGMFGARAGYRHRMNEKFCLEFMFGVEHCSDPFKNGDNDFNSDSADGDPGRNWQFTAIVLKYNF